VFESEEHMFGIEQFPRRVTGRRSEGQTAGFVCRWRQTNEVVFLFADSRRMTLGLYRNPLRRKIPSENIRLGERFG
jgi:hypothetical protein